MTQSRPEMISKCKIKPTENDQNGSGMLAYASILIDGNLDPRLGKGVWLHDWEIYRSSQDGRVYVSAPRRYDEKGRRWRTITFEDKEVQDRFEDFVLGEYRKYISKFLP